MKTFPGKFNIRVFILIAALCAAAALPVLSYAQPFTSSISITNNSGREIRHVYMSHVNANDWSGDQLNAVLASGQSASVNMIMCDQGQVKVIAEDQDGCFLSTAVSCSGDASWTITSSTARDCGGN